MSLLRSALGQIADGSFRRYAGYRARQIDAIDPAEAQEETLLRLVHKARRTRFGAEHDFDTIRSVTDYQRQVPLRTYEEFWGTYWQRSLHDLRDLTWPGRIPYVALSSGTTSGTTKYIPISREMLASNRRAALTSLAWFQAAHPQASLFSGQMFLLGGSTDLRPLEESAIGRRCALAGDLSGIAARELPVFARPFSYPPLDVALLSDWERKLDLMAAGSLGRPITLVGGVPSWLLALFGRILLLSGRNTIAEIWPQLAAVVHGGTKFDPYRDRFRQVVGSDTVQFLETYPASEGFVAAEDPRYKLLRLIPDHGVFFEFVPVDELASNLPTRHSVETIVPGVQYAVVLTTCAGLWSYLLGDTVCFESRDPPLLRFTGRTRQFLSAFGEHLIGEEVERAMAAAAVATSSAVIDFHVGPVFPEYAGQTGYHRYFVEFADSPTSLASFTNELDAALCRINEDYLAHRAGDLTMRRPEVLVVPRGGFAEWMRLQGKLGGQHKVPRIDNSGSVTRQLSQWLSASTGAVEADCNLTAACRI